MIDRLPIFINKAAKEIAYRACFLQGIKRFLIKHFKARKR